MARTRRTGTPLSTAALVAVLSLGAAACGTTVDQAGGLSGGVGGQGQGVDQGLSGAGSSAPQNGGSAAVGGVLPGSAGAGSSSGGSLPGSGSAAGAGSAGGAGSAQGGQRAGTSTAARSGKPPSTAAGVTGTTITIGLEYSEGSEQANKAAGFEGITTGNQRKQLELMVAEINRTGGIAGRTVKPVFHVYDASSSESTASQEQAACSTFTEDNKVFAVIAGGTHSEVFLSCLKKANVPFIAAPGLTISDDDVLNRYPLYVELNTVGLSRQGQLYGRALANAGYYDKGAKIGLLTFSLPNYERMVSRHLEPALAQVGQKLEDKVAVAFPQSSAETGSFGAAVGNAVLRFRQKGITHVLLTDVNGLMTVLFLQTAANQKYYPRYGWQTQNGGQAVADLTPDKRTLQGAIQLGWFPAIDLNAQNETIKPPGSKRCLDFFASKGYAAASRNEQGVVQFQCDIFFYAQAAGSRVSTLTAQSFVQAYGGIGKVVPSATTYQVDLGRNRDGAAGYRVQKWVDACECFKATTGVLPVG